MDNGFTGIDFVSISAQIKGIYNTIQVAIKQIDHDIGNDFFPKLRKNWASSNAVQFANEFQQKLFGYLKTIGSLGDRIIEDINYSAETYANSVGDSFYCHVGCLSNYPMLEFNLVLDNKNKDGITGMNFLLVEDLLNNELPMVKTNALNILRELPNSISFFDINNDQYTAYNTRKQSIINLVDEIVSTIESEIRSYYEIEKNQLLLAKQRTVQNIGGNGSVNA